MRCSAKLISRIRCLRRLPIRASAISRTSISGNIGAWNFPRPPASACWRNLTTARPALAQIPVGKGNLLVLASGWNPADSQFAVSSKFPPFMQTLLDWSGAAAPARFQFSTGDAIPSPASSGGEVQWQKPDGKTEALAAGKPFTETDLPGIYTATFGGKQRRFAVNLPLDESRTAPMSPDELARLGVPLQTPGGIPVRQGAGTRSVICSRPNWKTGKNSGAG